MTKTSPKTTERVIFELKQSIDNIYEKYGDQSLLDSLPYADNEYGVMQRAELEVIMGALDSLKRHVDGLLEDCLSIPAEFNIGGRAASQVMLNDKISLVELINALET